MLWFGDRLFALLPWSGASKPKCPAPRFARQLPEAAPGRPWPGGVRRMLLAGKLAGAAALPAAGAVTLARLGPSGRRRPGARRSRPDLGGARGERAQRPDLGAQVAAAAPPGASAAGLRRRGAALLDRRVLQQLPADRPRRRRGPAHAHAGPRSARHGRRHHPGRAPDCPADAAAAERARARVPPPGSGRRVDRPGLRPAGDRLAVAVAVLYSLPFCSAVVLAHVSCSTWS